MAKQTVEQGVTVADRFWLFTISAASLAVIGFIVVSVVAAGKMPESGEAVLMATITGLLMIVQKVIDAATQRRMADQLSQSRPGNGTGDGTINTDEVNVEGKNVSVTKK